MNKHGSSSSLSINMEPGVHEPFKVILQLYMDILFFFFFLGGEPRAFIRSSRRFMTQGSFRATNLFLDQMHVYWGEMASKNIIVSRAIIYEGLWWLISYSLKSKEWRWNCLILYMQQHHCLYTWKACSEDFGFCFKYLKARDFVHVITWFHIMRNLEFKTTEKQNNQQVLSFFLKIFILL